jgi:hypothetical protein
MFETQPNGLSLQSADIGSAIPAHLCLAAVTAQRIAVVECKIVDGHSGLCFQPHVTAGLLNQVVVNEQFKTIPKLQWFGGLKITRPAVAQVSSVGYVAPLS